MALNMTPVDAAATKNTGPRKKTTKVAKVLKKKVLTGAGPGFGGGR